MADQEKSSPSETDEKRRRDLAGKVGQAHGDGPAEADVESGGTVGREVPDQSKEHNTEIAVEAGRKGTHPEDKPADSKR
jgi:hypothetical protein